MNITATSTNSIVCLALSFIYFCYSFIFFINFFSLLSIFFLLFLTLDPFPYFCSSLLWLSLFLIHLSFLLLLFTPVMFTSCFFSLSLFLFPVLISFHTSYVSFQLPYHLTIRIPALCAQKYNEENKFPWFSVCTYLDVAYKA